MIRRSASGSAFKARANSVTKDVWGAKKWYYPAGAFYANLAYKAT
jgi:hypothetical protein